jgi:hypothetical protein
MKSLSELMANLKDDPEKERLRDKLLAEAHAWEEAEPPAPHHRPPPVRRHMPPPGAEDPLLARLLAATPTLDSAQRHMLETLLESWGH